MFVLDDQNNGFVEGEKICQGLRTPIFTVYCLQVDKLEENCDPSFANYSPYVTTYKDDNHSYF